MATLPTLVTTGLEASGFDASGYYALFTFGSALGSSVIAVPTEQVDELAEAALFLHSQRRDLSGPNPTTQAFRVRGGSVLASEDGSHLVLRLAFGKMAEIQFALPSQDAAALGHSLLRFQSGANPAQGAGQ